MSKPFTPSQIVESAFDLTTKQGIFDHVATALLKQGNPAMSSDGRACRYEGDDGTQCAVGVLIPTKKRREIANMNGEVTEYSTVTDTAALRFMDKRIPRTRETKRLLSALQRAHDGPALEDLRGNKWLYRWKQNMVTVAYDFGLSDRLVAA